MRCVLLCVIFLAGCGNDEPQSSEEFPFTFNGKWKYDQKMYQFEEAPLKQIGEGMRCVKEITFAFSDAEFEITIAEGVSCQNYFYYVLAYDLIQVNDSTHVLKSNRLIRSNYKPSREPDFSDIPLIDNQVKLIIRSTNEFVTYL